MRKELLKSKTDRMLTGVCGGLGAYLGIGSTLVRIVFGLLILLGIPSLGVTPGIAITVYIVLMIAMPSKSKNENLPTTSFNCDKPNCGYAYSISQGDSYCRSCSKKLTDVITHN